MKAKFRHTSFLILSLYVIIALLANIIANHQPLYFKNETGIYFPALSNNPYIKYNSDHKETLLRKESVDWNAINGKKIFPPIHYSGNESSSGEILIAPSLSEQHILGTGRSGNDILAAIIHGCQTSLLLGVFSMLIAAFIGIAFGIISGYYGDTEIKLDKRKIYFLPLTFVIAWFYGFTIHQTELLNGFSTGTFNGVFVLLNSLLIFSLIFLSPFLFPANGRSIRLTSIPLKSYISILTEWFSSLPRLIIIITLSAFIHPSVTTIILVIGLTSWPEIARTVAALVSSLKEKEFIQASKAIGLSDLRLILQHVLPNIIRPIYALLLFTIAAAIITEAGLSFLGIGLPAGTISWGQILAEGRENSEAWWLIVFPGLAITGLLVVLQRLADTLTEKKK